MVAALRHEGAMAIVCGRLIPGVLGDAGSAPRLAGRNAPGDAPSPRIGDHERRRQVHAAEIRLLYENATTGIIATVVLASLLTYIQRDEISRGTLVAWLLYVVLVSAARLVLVRRYWSAAPGDAENDWWKATFVAGAAMAAAGWGVGAILLYPPAGSADEIAIVFSVGGVMLGGASLLAARPEAFLTFLIPTGLLTAVRVAAPGDEDHLMMGLLGVLFTAVIVITTWRFHRAIESSFRFRFDNVDLVETLQTAKSEVDALNHDLEIRVRERTARLVQEDRRKDEFLATLAHELRNPLAPIRFALETMRVDAPPVTAARARDVIDRQVGQLVRLVDDLLDVSRITANKIQLRREPIELGRLMATAVESIAPLAMAADHTLDVQLPSAPICVHGDGARLVQVFANVLNNAAKFTPRGGRIWFTAEQQSSHAVVRIRDTGVGIAPDVLPRVFDMFHQAELVLERSTGGLGIGLTLARRLVQMHDGEIEIRSPGTGQGTEVEIRLPVTALAATTATAAQEAPVVASTRSIRVLIVEDDPDAAEMLALTLSRLGHVTRIAHDGTTAITAAIEFAPELILLDIGLPVMNGYLVARKLRAMQQFTGVHMAAVTGWGQEEDRRKAREAGCDSHFTKPLSPDALEELLARVARPATDGSRPHSTPRTRLADAGGGF
jgi:signal transduction histidine kinase/ActR/RegA family two-component response regulator